MNTKNNQNIENISILRGIAALSVAFFHITLFGYYNFLLVEVENQPLEHYKQAFGLLGFIDWGRFGVCIFFIISGFLIPHSIKKINLSSFVKRRFFRLYPMYWFSIVLAAFVYVFLRHINTFKLQDYLINLTMIQQLIGQKNLIDAFWTLQVELIFYGICIFNIYFLKSKFEKYHLIISMLFVVFVAIARFYTGKDIPIIPFIALVYMFWGEKIRLGSSLLLNSIYLIAFSIFISFLSYKDTHIMYSITYTLSIVTFLIIMSFKVKDQSFFIWRYLVFLGEISYSIYLIHVPVGEYLAYSFRDYLNLPIILLISISIVILISSITYYLIENPFIKFSRIGKFS